MIIYADHVANEAVKTGNIQPLVDFYLKDNPFPESLRHGAEWCSVLAKTVGNHPNRARFAMRARAQLIAIKILTKPQPSKLP